MTKKTYTTITAVLLLLNLVWCTGLVIVGDFYPHLKTLQMVLEVKAFFNGFLSVTALCFMPFAMTQLEKERH